MGRAARQKGKTSSRAARYSVPMLLHYKASSEEVWYPGKVENISRTGVLFEAEKLLGKDAEIEMALELPSQGRVGNTGNIFVVGKIVRTVMPASSDGMPSMAARIQRYKMFPKGKMPSVQLLRSAARTAGLAPTPAPNKRKESER